MFLPLFNPLFCGPAHFSSCHPNPFNGSVKVFQLTPDSFHTPLTPFVCQQLFQFCFQNIERVHPLLFLAHYGLLSLSSQMNL